MGSVVAGSVGAVVASVVADSLDIGVVTDGSVEIDVVATSLVTEPVEVATVSSGAELDGVEVLFELHAAPEIAATTRSTATRIPQL